MPSSPPSGGLTQWAGLSRWPRRSRCLPDGLLAVPEAPIVPYIEGDGTGVDIWPAAQRVFDAAAAKYGRRIRGKRCSPGEGVRRPASGSPRDVEAFREHLIGIKGPLTTPVGGGFRSLNVALRQMLDLYVCLRRCAGSPVCPRRSCIPRRSTW